MDNNVVQQQATQQDIIDAHMTGSSGYEIADKFGLDTEQVKQIIREADAAGKFIPSGAKPPVDSPVVTVEPVVEPLVEGDNPESKKATTKNNP